MLRVRKPVKKHVAAALIGIAVLVVEAWAFLTLLDWADTAATDLAAPDFLISVTVIILAPPAGIVLVWLLENS